MGTTIYCTQAHLLAQILFLFYIAVTVTKGIFNNNSCESKPWYATFAIWNELSPIYDLSTVRCSSLILLTKYDSSAAWLSSELEAARQRSNPIINKTILRRPHYLSSFVRHSLCVQDQNSHGNVRRASSASKWATVTWSGLTGIALLLRFSVSVIYTRTRTLWS